MAAISFLEIKYLNSNTAIAIQLLSTLLPPFIFICPFPSLLHPKHFTALLLQALVLLSFSYLFKLPNKRRKL